MEAPILVGLLTLGLSGAGLLIAAMIFDGRPPLALLLGITWFSFFSLGLLFDNLNAFAMRPLADLAGLGSSIIASGSSLVAFVFASVVETVFTAPVWVLAWALALAAPMSAFFILLAIPAQSRKQFFRTIRSRR